MEFKKSVNLIDTASDDKDQDLLLKNRLNFFINQKETTILTKKLELKLRF